MSACTRCASPPKSPASLGTLFLAPPLVHSLGVLREMFRAEGIAFEEPSRSVLSIALVAGRLEEVVDALDRSLGEVARRDTRCLILEEGSLPSLDDLMRTQPLSTLMAGVQQRWLFEMIQHGRMTTHFQPIVRLDDPCRVYAYECLLRGLTPDGSLIPPTKIYDAAREADLLFQVDRAARLVAIREANTHRIRENLFINFNPTSIYDPNFCLRSTIAAIDEAGIDPSRVVFEVVESDKADVDLLGIMDAYRKAGFRVALDDLGAGYGSLNLLSSLRPDIVKLDIRLIRDVDLDPYKAGIAAKLLELGRELGIETIAEGIETEGEFEWFREHGADYGQGYYLARPASPPPPVRRASPVEV